jgi:uncharacterized protein YvpB
MVREGSGGEMRWLHGWVRVVAGVLMLGFASPVAADFSALAAPAVSPSHIIEHFPLMGQSWNLSCEYAATSAATAYFGNTISQDAFVNMIGFDANPNKGFRGDLSGPWGGTWHYGVYAPPILAVLMQNGFTHSYMFQADPMLLREAISNDRPVVVWISGTYSSMPRYEEESDGEQFLLVPYEHAVTIYGYDEQSVSIMDPAYPAYYTVSWDIFLNAWQQLDGMALAVAV